MNVEPTYKAFFDAVYKATRAGHEVTFLPDDDREMVVIVHDTPGHCHAGVPFGYLEKCAEDATRWLIQITEASKPTASLSPDCR